LSANKERSLETKLTQCYPVTHSAIEVPALYKSTYLLTYLLTLITVKCATKFVTEYYYHGRMYPGLSGTWPHTHPSDYHTLCINITDLAKKN